MISAAWYTWVLSGVGVAVPLAIVSWIWHWRSARSTANRSLSQISGDSSRNIQIGPGTKEQISGDSSVNIQLESGKAQIDEQSS